MEHLNEWPSPHAKTQNLGLYKDLKATTAESMIVSKGKEGPVL